jgi:hypothetical protein
VPLASAVYDAPPWLGQQPHSAAAYARSSRRIRCPCSFPARRGRVSRARAAVKDLSQRAKEVRRRASGEVGGRGRAWEKTAEVRADGVTGVAAWGVQVRRGLLCAAFLSLHQCQCTGHR